MSALPFKINDRRGTNHHGGSNTLYEAATQTTKRKRIPHQTRDHHRNLSDLGWRELMSAARWVTARFGPVVGGIRQMCNYAIGQGFNAQYYGRNKSWGVKMEAALEEFDKVCDVRGSNTSFREGLMLDLFSIIRDGDTTSLLTSTANGYPQFQAIPAHRIGCSFGGLQKEEGGRTVINGVVMDSVGRPIGYRVYSDEFNGGEYREISTRDAAMYFTGDYHEQVRGVTWLAPCINDVADIFEIRSFLKIALKAESETALIEHNEQGAPPPASGGGSFMLPSEVYHPTTGAALSTDDAAVFTEVLEGGSVRYFRSNTGGKLEAMNSGRPHPDSAKFHFEILRGAFEALGWPIEFYNPESLGGANIRMRVAQAKRMVEKLQAMAEKIAQRKHRYAIAKLINLGVLEPDVDWWKITHQRPRSLTVDNGHDTKALLDLYLVGAMDLEELCAGMGTYWEDVQDKNIEIEKRLQERAKEEGVDPGRIQMKPAGWNGGIPPVVEGEDGEGDDTEDPEATKREFDAYGVGVRAGAITPTIEDEEHFRARVGLPALSAGARESWSKEKGVRRPITLTPPPGSTQSMPGQPAQKPNEDEEDEE